MTTGPGRRCAAVPKAHGPQAGAPRPADLKQKQEGFRVKNNKVTVTIAGVSYNLISEEETAYMEKVAAHVDEKIHELDGSGISTTEAGVLAALNIADEYYKALATGEHLRSQIKELLEEGAKLKAEISEKNREIFKLQNKKG